MYINSNPRPRALSDDQIRRIAPSVFAASPWGGMSSKYRFIPTIQVIDHLRSHGFQPVKATQSKARIAGKGEFTRHMLKFQSETHLNLPTVVDKEFPEVVLTNSHDGACTYGLEGGIFRLVCSNGMIISTENFGKLKVRHSGKEDICKMVLDATYQIVDQTETAVKVIDDWKAISLTAPQQNAFAVAALDAIEKPGLRPHQLLDARRAEDRPNQDGTSSLWNTLNRVQENATKGGLTTYSPSGRRNKTRPIKAVQNDLAVNRALWRLADEMAKLAN